MDIDQMPVGRDMDKLVAEKLFGWVRLGKIPDRRITSPGYGAPMDAVLRIVPHYSTDIADAWEVIERLRQLQFIVRLSASNGQYGWPQKWEVAAWRSVYRGSGLVVGDCRKVPYEKRREVSFKAEADGVPLAICRAALKVIADD